MSLLLMRRRDGVIVSDTFTRDDSALTLGSAETGQAYIVDAGTHGVSSNRAYSVTDADADQVRLESGVANGTFEMTVRGTLNSGVNFRVPLFVFRGNGQYEYLYCYLFAGSLYLSKNDGVGSDSITQLAALAGLTTADNTDYVLRAVCDGNSIPLYVDGVLRITHTLAGGDTKYAAYTQVGMRLAVGGSPATAARWDDLSVQAGTP